TPNVNGALGVRLVRLKGLGESVIEYRWLRTDPHDPFERRKPAHELGGELDKTGSGEHRDCPEPVFVRDQPSRPLSADVDGGAAAVAEEDQAAGRGERSGGAAASHLLVIPNGTAGLDVECADVALAPRLAAGCAVEEPIAELEGLGDFLVHRAGLGRQNVKEL